MFFIYATKIFKHATRTKLTLFILIIFSFNSFVFFVIKDHPYNFKKTFSRKIEFNQICQYLDSGVAASNSLSLKNYVMVGHSKFDEAVVNKICNEIN